MKLKELRERKKITQEELAKLLKIEQNTYSNYEKEKTQPKLETLIKIADFYNVSLDYLLERKNIGGLSTQEYELITMFRQLIDSEQKRVIGYLKMELELSENLKTSNE